MQIFILNFILKSNLNFLNKIIKKLKLKLQSLSKKAKIITKKNIIEMQNSLIINNEFYQVRFGTI